MFNTDSYEKDESLTRNIQRAFMAEETAIPEQFNDLLNQLRAAELADQDQTQFIQS
jgi:hypothetical protein